MALGGVLVGGIIGYLVARLLYHIDDPIVEMMLTTCLAFGAYLVAEQIHVSGVLAVVMAGLMHGYIGFGNMSERTTADREYCLGLSGRIGKRGDFPDDRPHDQS